MDNLTQLFYDEAYEMVAGMEQLLLSLEAQTPDPEVVNALFRYAHSFKGNSAAMGFTQLSRFTHGLESAMEVLRREQRPLTPQMTNLLLQAVDLIRALLERTRTEGDVNDPACDQLLNQLNAALGSDQSDLSDRSDGSDQAARGEGASRRYRVRYQPAPTLTAEHDPLSLLRELEEYAQIVEARFQHQIPPLAELKPDSCYGEWELLVETAYEPAILRAVLELSAEGATVQIEAADEPDKPDESDRSDRSDKSDVADQAAPPAPTIAASLPTRTETQSIRVATDKVDALFNLVSEIVIAQSMLSSAQSATTDERLRYAITQMERHIRELHERVMAIRLLPISYLFNRFPRMVRDTAAQLGKQVNLVIEGEETELDRTLLESLGDPLTHLVRNAIDHGIEPPAERRARGKPEIGTLTLSAYQAEGRIYIEVRDDGRGIDTEQVRQKAIQLGWLREGDQPSPETLYEFLFRPGFSTAQQVSDLSGRGVGMDVVKRNVESLGGAISIQSEPGKGARFILKVPLTLAILDGLGLRVGDEQYIVPLTTVVEAFRLDSLSASALFEREEVVNVRGRFMPLMRLRQFIGLPSQRQEQLMLVLEQEGQPLALAIDGIVGQQQVVLKSLEENFTRVPGFAGATILGDGRVALILDVAYLIQHAYRTHESLSAA
jgi:two-component system chemotaxis sensor kinase CheA